MCRPDNTKNQSGVYIKLEGLNTSVVWVWPSQPPCASYMVDWMTASAPSTEWTWPTVQALELVGATLWSLVQNGAWFRFHAFWRSMDPWRTNDLRNREVLRIRTSKKVGVGLLWLPRIPVVESVLRSIAAGPYCFLSPTAAHGSLSSQ
jgi:hypothetical protein